MLQFKSLRTLIIIFIVLDCILNIQYFTPTLILDKFELSIYIDGFIVETAQLIAGVLSYFLIYKYRRRTMAIYSFELIAFCALVLVFIWDQNNADSHGTIANFIIMAFIFLIEFSISN